MRRLSRNGYAFLLSESSIELEDAAEIDGAVKNFQPKCTAAVQTHAGNHDPVFLCKLLNTYFNAVMYMTSTSRSPLQVYVQKIVLSNISDIVDLSTDLANTVPQEVMRMAAVAVVGSSDPDCNPFMQKISGPGDGRSSWADF